MFFCIYWEFSNNLLAIIFFFLKHCDFEVHTRFVFWLYKYNVQGLYKIQTTLFLLWFISTHNNMYLIPTYIYMRGLIYVHIDHNIMKLIYSKCYLIKIYISILLTLVGVLMLFTIVGWWKDTLKSSDVKIKSNMT